MSAETTEFTGHYFQHYQDAGFSVLEEGPLYRNDGSTVFASCTISNYRGPLAGESEEPGSVMVQTCFRGRPLAELHLPTRPSRRSLFHMYGGFETADEEDAAERIAIHTDIFQAVLRECGVDPADIACVASASNLSRWGLDGPDAGIYPYGTQRPDGVQLPDHFGKEVKAYGEGITGNGVELSVRQGEGNPWRWFGSVAETVSADGQVTGVDFGGGLEATTVALYGDRGYYLEREMCERFALPPALVTDPRSLNLLEAYEALVTILGHETERHPLSSTNNEIAFAARAIIIQADALSFSPQLLRSLGDRHHQLQQYDHQLEDNVFDVIQARQQATADLVLAAQQGLLGHRIERRRAQAEDQGHPFGALEEAKIINCHLHELDPNTSLPKPQSLHILEIRTAIDRLRETPYQVTDLQQLTAKQG